MPANSPLRADEWLASGSPSPSLVVAGVPTSLGVPGSPETWRAPAAVRAALRWFPACDREAGVDLGSLAVRDLGDWDVAGLGAADAGAVVERHARDLAGGPPALFLGGDESVLGPLVAGLSRGEVGGVGVLTIGAHRAAGTGSGTGEWPAAGPAPGRVVQVGIHAFAEPVAAPWGVSGVEVVTLDALDEVGAGWVVTSALNDLAEACSWVFVGIDLGVLDAAFAPGSRTARPGGMTPRQLLAGARAAGAHRAVAAADLVGLDPARDPMGLTVLNAAGVLLAYAAGLVMREAVR